MQRYVCGFRINILDAFAATFRYDPKAFLHEYTNLHSASEGSKYNSLAGVIADLLFSLLQLKKQVRCADIYFYVMSADASKHTPSHSFILTFEFDLIAYSKFNIARVH